jgi:hypothetical protein
MFVQTPGNVSAVVISLLHRLTAFFAGHVILPQKNYIA